MAGPKILLVDDNSELLILLAQMLTDAGYTPMPFARGRPAIEKMVSHASRAWPQCSVW